MKPEDDIQLHAYLDGELGATEALLFERRLADDAQLRSYLSELRAMRARIRSQASYHEAPAALRERVLRGSRRLATPGHGPRTWWWSLAATACLVALALIAIAPGWLHAGGGSDARVMALLDDHLRASLDGRWVDVVSSDRHTVKPWLSARLGFSPVVPDLSGQGFELLGARLDVLDAQPIAALVYRRRQHMISVFVWPDAEPVPAGAVEQRGYHIVRFQRDGMWFWAVSDLNTAELRDLANLMETAT